ncbi:MAG: type I-C CRISPR-associated protein Cas7/Csd2 [Oscillospiraceae bacterium]|jgi:CRISPR-associated protein Csd2|nr:type I-C CRISPR-associated protein Cas7/Csd2 [Oscillospiraceae bacterium]
MFENAIKNRYEFIIFYDVENGNPNGDPDAGNLPRIDPETGHGIVTDVCIKRKIRNYVDMVKEGEQGFDIYVKQDRLLNVKDEEIISTLKSGSSQDERDLGFKSGMCQKYYDIRTFGAVMTTAGKKDKKDSDNKEKNKLRNTAGQVRGPVQLAFGKSVDPIVPREISITRMAITNEKDKEKSNTMGNKFIVPYALYRQEGFISANLAEHITGFSDDDLNLLWEAIENMFEFDRSAARGKMAARELIIFKHENVLGNAPAHKLFDLVKAEKTTDGAARSFSDYTITVDTNAPDGIEIIRKSL